MQQNLTRTLTRLRTTFMSFTLGQRLVVAVGGAALRAEVGAAVSDGVH